MTTQDDKPAFPITAGNQVYCTGMTLRDYFAAQAIAGMMANCDSTGMNGWLGAQDHLAKFAYNIADAMMKERGNE